VPLRPCAEAGCPNPARRGRPRCEAHDKKRERERSARRRQDAARKPYTTGKWKHTARRVRFEQPLCVRCGRIATDTDHVVPIRDGGAPYSLDNLQPLCRECHGLKSADEQRARG
jgi:5-methylcytosine-specific restriction protein A